MKPVDDGSKTEALDLDMDLTISNAAEIMAALKKGLKKAGHLVIKVADGAAVDVAGLQLLCSAHRTADCRGKRVSVSEPYTEPFKRCVISSGFARRIGCNETCLWTKGQ